MDHGEDPFSTQKPYLEVAIIFLTGSSVIAYNNFDCDEKKII